MIHLGHVSAWWLVLAFYLGGIIGFFLAALLAISGRASRAEEAEAARRQVQGELEPWEHA